MRNGRSPIKIWREARRRYRYLGKVGRLASFTRIRQGPAGFEKQTPYWAGIIEFRNNEKITGQIVGVKGKKLRLGMKVEGVLRRLGAVEKKGVIEYGVKFKVV
jgi:hypothetical protein